MPLSQLHKIYCSETSLPFHRNDSLDLEGGSMKKQEGGPVTDQKRDLQQQDQHNIIAA